MALRYTRNPYQQDGHDFQRCRGFGGGNVDTGYHYGYPAYGAVEPNVVAQWLFDEYWDNFTGITQAGAAGFQNASNNASTIGVSAAQSAIVTSTASLSASAAGYNFLYSYGDAYSAGKGIYLYYLTSDGKVHFEVNDDSGHLVDLGGTYALADGLIHNVTGVFTRSGTSEIFVDNVSLGTASVAAVTQAFTNTGKVSVGTSGTTGNYWLGTIYEVAVGAGVTTLGTRGPGSGVTPYNYVSASQAGLVFHTKMQEASGNITDSKNSIVLTAGGSHTYSVAGAGKAAAIYDEVSGIKLTYNGSYDANQTATDAYAGLSPGMKNTSASPTHLSAAGTASLDWTCNDGMTFEAWFKSTTNTAGQYWGLYNEGNGENANLRAYYFYTGASPTFAFYLRSSDNTSKLWTPAVSTSVFDGNLHKVRLVVDPNGSGNGELFIDGVSQGTSTFAAFVGKTVTHELSRMGAIWASNSVTSNTTIYEIRESHNITNNSGGIGGG